MHPQHIVTDESWEVIRLAASWREGVLPCAGGTQDQPLRLVSQIETVLTAWRKLREDREEKRKDR